METMFEEKISKDELSKLEAETFEGTIHLVENEEQVEEAVEALQQSSVLGFDTETKPNFRKGGNSSVSLLQLSNATDAYLFRLNRVGLKPSLIGLLSNDAILKVGVSVKGDYMALRRLEDFQPGGFVELQRLCPGYGIRDESLQKIYAILFGKRISKSQRLTNWENASLTTAQQSYAALDAWAGYRIYQRLMEEETPEPVKFALL